MSVKKLWQVYNFLPANHHKIAYCHVISNRTFYKCKLWNIFRSEQVLGKVNFPWKKPWKIYTSGGLKVLQLGSSILRTDFRIGFQREKFLNRNFPTANFHDNLRIKVTFKWIWTIYYLIFINVRKTRPPVIIFQSLFPKFHHANCDEKVKIFNDIYEWNVIPNRGLCDKIHSSCT